MKKKEKFANIHAIMPYGGILFIGHADISFIPDGFKKEVSADGTYYIKKVIMSETI